MGSIELDPNCLTGRPLRLSDLAEDEYYLTRAYAYNRKCPKDIQEILAPVLRMASDQFCNMCYELGIEDPSKADFSEYKSLEYKIKSGD